MKKILCLFLCVILLLSACAKTPTPSGNAKVYYLRRSFSHELPYISLVYETREFAELPAADLYMQAIDAMHVPSEAQNQPAILNTVRLNSLDIHGDTVIADFSKEFDALPDVEKTITSSAVALTLFSFPEVSYVKVTSAGKNQPPIYEQYFSRDTIILDTGQIELNAFDITLYYIDRVKTKLAASNTVVKTDATGPTSATVLDFLMKHGKSQSSFDVPFMGMASWKTEMKSDGVCNVDLVGSMRGYDQLDIYGIINTLCSLPGIESVLLTVNGQPLSLYGFAGFDEPVGFNKDIVE